MMKNLHKVSTSNACVGTSLTYAINTNILSLLALVAVFFTSTTVAAQLSGTKNIPGDYPTLNDAITALNTQGVGAGGVILNLIAGNPETAPAGGYVIGGTGSMVLTTSSSTNTIIVQGNGNIITAPTPQASGALNDAIFKLIGADWVTISGFTMNENASNTTTAAGTNNMTEWGVALLYVTTTDGAQNNTIQNNTITLNRTYQNTFGVYSNSTHSSTSITTSATATTANGANSNLKIYTNNISNVNLGIVIVGPTAAADPNLGIDIGGSSLAQGNTLTNFGTTGTFSGYLNVSGTVNGILVRNSIGFNISYNTITSSVGGVTSGTLNGIQIPAASNAPTTTFTNNITNNTFSLQSGVASGVINGINFPSGSASTTSVLNINSNNFINLSHTVSGTGAISAIICAGANFSNSISNNTFTNISCNTTGSFTFISHSASLPANGSKSVNNNSIVTGFNKTGAGGTVSFMTTNGSSPNAATCQYSGNIISNITVTGATTVTGISDTDGSSSSPTKNYINNTVSNITGGTSTITAMTISYVGGTTNISSNNFTNLTGQGTITGLTIGSTANLANPLTVSNNTISNLTSSGTGGAVTGISCSNTSTVVNISSNNINTLSSTGASAIQGIVVSGATQTNVFSNKIYDLSGSNASSTVSGLTVSAGTNIKVYNNLIGNLSASIANASNPVIGLNLTGGTTISADFNTVNINTSSSGTNFGSSAVFANTTSNITLRNNILVNTSTANGTGLTVAHRRSTTTLTTYNNASNNNNFFAGTPSATNLIFSDGTNADQTLSAYQARVTPRDALAVSSAPTFLSLTGTSSNFLHIDGTLPSPLESAGGVVSGITTDFDEETRNAITPDIGADEFSGIPIFSCSSPMPGNTVASINNICYGQTIELSAQNPTMGTGNTFQWQSSNDNVSWNDITGQINPTYVFTPLSSKYYRLVITCANGPSIGNSNGLLITFDNNVLTTTPGTNCGIGSVELQATADGGTLNWYGQSTGGNVLGSGGIFNTPIISTTTDYYVSSEVITNVNVGPLTTVSGCGTLANSTSTDWPIRINLASKLNIISFDVFTNAAGNYTFKLRKALSSTDSLTATFSLASGLNTVTVNWNDIPSGNWQVTSTVANLHRISSFSCTYPFASASGNFQIVGSASSSTGATSTTSYNCFFNFVIGDYCSSPREKVTATITPPPSLTLSTDSLLLCSNEISSVTVTSNISDFDNYSWSPITGLFLDATATTPYNNESVSTIYIKNSATSSVTYTLLASNSMTDCSNSKTVVVTTIPASAAVTANIPSFCEQGSTSLTITPVNFYGSNSIQWQSSIDNIAFTNISGANAGSYTTPNLTMTTFYRVEIKNGAGNVCFLSTSDTVQINNPMITGTMPGSRCGTGSVMLQATSSAGSMVEWYENATGGIALNTGNSFNTPSISTTTTYYAQSAFPNSLINGARSAPAATSSTTPLNYGLVFDLNQNVTLYSVNVYNSSTTSSGTLTIQLQNSAGQVLQTSSVFTVPAAAVVGTSFYTCNLNWAIPAGTGYRLLATTGTASLIREISLGGYPYQIGTAGNITSGYISGVSTTYYYFYNWSVGTPCVSPTRTPVVATINQSPSISATVTQDTICNGEMTTLSVTSINDPNYTYTWQPGNLSGSTQIVNPSQNQQYIVTAMDLTTGNPSSGCSSMDTVNIIVFNNPTALNLSNSISSLCVGQVSELSATGGLVPSTKEVSRLLINKLIPDNVTDTLRDTIIMAGMPASGFLDSIIVTLNITHPFISDLDIYLRAPNGNTLELSTDNGSTGANYTNTRLTTLSTAPDITLASAPFTGTFRAEGYLSMSNLESVLNGNWQLLVFDDFADDQGSLLNWSLKLVSTGQAPITWSPTTGLFTNPGATVAYTGGPASTVYASPGSSINYTATATSPFGCTATSSVSIEVTGDEVMNENNAGTGSLRKAIECTAAGDTVFVSSGSVNLINLLTQLNVDKPLLILDDNGSPVMLKFDFSSGALMTETNGGFRVGTMGNVTLDNIQIKHVSNDATHPVVKNEGILTLKNSKITGETGNTIPPVVQNAAGATINAEGNSEIKSE